MKLNIVTLAIIAVGVALFSLQAAGMPWTLNRIVGLSIALPALVLLVVARFQLGRAFSISAKASILVTSGLYSRIRNPIYVFGMFVFLGLIIWIGNPWLLVVFAILIPMQVVRIRNEAKVLEEKFGDEYVAYRRRTWF
ncbi:MAG: isoprenylcysteine carboxylmethyltransferase family protein [Terracidiphilus sp.]